jgi:hypothetical protein
LAESKTIKGKIEAVSLDDWVVEPISIDDWNVAVEKKAEPKIEAVSLDEWVVEPISIDDWNIPNEEPPVKKVIKIKPVILVKNDLKEIINAKIAASKIPEQNHADILKLSETDLKKVDEAQVELKEADLKEQNELAETKIEQLITTDNDKAEESEIEDSFAEIEIDFSPEREETSTVEVIEKDETTESQVYEAAAPETQINSNSISLELADLAKYHIVDEKVVIRLSEDHLYINSKLDVLRLTNDNLATSFEPVKRLSENDLFINSDETVLRLRSIDKKVNHRVLIDLDESFFAENDITVNTGGTIVLKHEDLVNQEVDELDESSDIAEEVPKKSVRVKRAKREVKKGISDAQIVRYSMYVIIIIIFLLPFTFHFKYSWETVSEERFEEASQKSYDYFLKYRTDESWHRFYGRQLLDRNSYEKAAEENGFFTWFLYSNSGSIQRGDSYP